jgi:toxin YoeB
MEVDYTDNAKSHILFWKKSGNKIIQNKIQQLIFAIEMDNFNGIGKPEPLKHELTGLWSRRINQEHRLVYEIDEVQNKIIIHSLKGHY